MERLGDGRGRGRDVVDPSRAGGSGEIVNADQRSVDVTVARNQELLNTISQRRDRARQLIEVFQGDYDRCVEECELVEADMLRLHRSRQGIIARIRAAQVDAYRQEEERRDAEIAARNDDAGAEGRRDGLPVALRDYLALQNRFRQSSDTRAKVAEEVRKAAATLVADQQMKEALIKESDELALAIAAIEGDEAELRKDALLVEEAMKSAVDNQKRLFDLQRGLAASKHAAELDVATGSLAVQVMMNWNAADHALEKALHAAAASKAPLPASLRILQEHTDVMQELAKECLRVFQERARVLEDEAAVLSQHIAAMQH